VEADNPPALALYAGYGFTDLYPYHYRVLSGGRAAAPQGKTPC